MKTEREMLDKIKWDEKEDKSAYIIAYKDKDVLKEIKFTDIKRVEDEFMIIDINGRETNIPLHRIKMIKKNGEIIWQR
ncbi:MAG TPA: DUF504 domain-containing protein [Candidatus Nanoarchaeia archaeon]|nr:DUF504 domain-containing protein [Candidatus Nanoarchaeia archaeon]